MKILLIIPPFTQLNTPYPSTAYLKPVLENAGHEVKQIDLGILTILEIFSENGLKKLYHYLEENFKNTEYEALSRFMALKDQYLATINPVIKFLQGQNDSAAFRINSGKWLPEGERQEYEIENELLGNARHKATLYLEEIGDIITNFCDPSFGFSRYAERLAFSPPEFTNIKNSVEKDVGFISGFFLPLLDDELKTFSPDIAGFTIPFPGNLLSSLICTKYIKNHFPQVKTIFGGGYINTELRELKDKDFFTYVDYVTLDDGEKPLLKLIEFIEDKTDLNNLKRTFLVNEKNGVEYKDNPGIIEIKQKDLPAPDYSGLMNLPYLSILPVNNNMHRLWSEGKWNKMTLAHGCYWHRCAFCDTSLDYIKRYEPVSAEIIVQRIEKVIRETNNYSFHFVDEAAPPALLKKMAVELLRKNISINWWTNIRFEKSFKPDLCRLLAKSGCIAISGGLEVASDRLLSRIDKGVTVEQVSSVAASLSSAGIMVHTYLMYGFPGQSEVEIIDALENVRQLFQKKLIDSAFWHQFALTAHSPAGCNPDRFNIDITGPENGSFARNDLTYSDDSNYDPSKYSSGLKNALSNFMIGKELNRPVNKWFQFTTPKTTVKKDFIKKLVDNKRRTVDLYNSSQFVWIGGKLLYKEGFIILHDVDGAEKIKADKRVWNFLSELIKICNIRENRTVTTVDVEKISEMFSTDFDDFLSSELFSIISSYGLLIL
jgi:radical SAM superfamily enzyme YgiQ (UPF0313 family)